MLSAFEEVFPGARYRPITVHFYRNVLGRPLVTKRKAAASMLKAIHVQESRKAPQACHPAINAIAGFPGEAAGLLE